MKKIISMLLVSAMAVSLIACGAPKNPTATEAPAAPAATETETAEVQDITLKVWAPEVDQKEGRGRSAAVVRIRPRSKAELYIPRN